MDRGVSFRADARESYQRLNTVAILSYRSKVTERGEQSMAMDESLEEQRQHRRNELDEAEPGCGRGDDTNECDIRSIEQREDEIC